MNYKNHKEMWGQKSNIQLLFLSILYVLLLSACGDQKTVLESIRESGELRFVTVESPLTYFKGSDGKAEGLEYELASMFADSLDLDLNLIIVKSFSSSDCLKDLIENRSTNLSARLLFSA